MPSNFDFLKSHRPEFHGDAVLAEKAALQQPRTACFYARFTMERAVKWMYAHDGYLREPYNATLSVLIHEESFTDSLKPGLHPKLKTILKVGNRAVHETSPLSQTDAVQVVRELFHFLYWLSRSYSPDPKQHPKVKFSAALIPAPTSAAAGDLNLKQVQALQKKLDAQAEKLSLKDEALQKLEARAEQLTAENEALLTTAAQLDAQDKALQAAQEQLDAKSVALEATEAEIAALKAKLTALREAATAIPDDHDYNEDETREYFIDLMLHEAGWPLDQEQDREFPVTGMPLSTNPKGNGFVDYVLWGDNGLPLAVVEAKRTRKDPKVGRHQAKLYADCLEQQYNQRPVIFYTNGYETWLWDDLNYPERPVQGFYKKRELERIIYRRANQQPLTGATVSPAIAGRSYQMEAIRRVTEAFEEKRRHALLVMATGTGKTRTSIALVEVLQQHNWASRILFLADRNALLNQAKGAFKTHLPHIDAIDITKEEAKNTTQLVLSTYPTMMNRINDGEDGERLFSPGHFDLIIIDEAHRSVYQKFGAIFAYFDALLLGLTATPRAEVDRNTYRLFELPKGQPTFAYELDQAVEDGYLVPARAVPIPFKFLQTGITYSELEAEEQEEYESELRDEDGRLPRHVNAAALNNWLFNANTVDQALQILMEKGQKVEAGDRLGKTVIFARNIKHARFIEERFNINYPKFKGAFAQVIHSEVSHAQSLIDDFGVASKSPHIAVSVDMLDTGIDVPEILNLVFFKPVRSKVKFHQMMGRGTRLCPDLFEPGADKEYFLAFDLCGNFEFFESQPKEKPGKLPKALSTRIFETRLALVQELAGKEHGALAGSLLDTLHSRVSKMNLNNFLVRPHRLIVETFSDREQWNSLSPVACAEIGMELADLPSEEPDDDFHARRFDLLILKLQVALLTGAGTFKRLAEQVQDLAMKLEEKLNIPMVEAKTTEILAAQADEYWGLATVDTLETLRLDLRDLIKFIDREKGKIVYTDFEDTLMVDSIEEKDVSFLTAAGLTQYRKKVTAFIESNRTHTTIAKLTKNLPLTQADLDALEQMLFSAAVVESREQFEAAFGDKAKTLPGFIRSIVGLDREAAKAAFSEFLIGNGCSADQIQFIEQIINHLTQNGSMDPGLLYEAPFTNLADDGLDGVFDDPDKADRIVAIIKEINSRVAS